MMDHFKAGQTLVTIVKGDITQTDMECIVNSANNHFWMGGGVAGAIKRAAGQIVETEAMALGPKAVGDAVKTSAGALPCVCIIHAAVMGQDLQTDDAIIRKAVQNSLQLAADSAVSSVALPAFGTGVGGFSHHLCAKIMLDETVAFLLRDSRLKKVQFVLFEDRVYQAFSERMKILFHL